MLVRTSYTVTVRTQTGVGVEVFTRNSSTLGQRGSCPQDSIVDLDSTRCSAVAVIADRTAYDVRQDTEDRCLE